MDLNSHHQKPENFQLDMLGFFSSGLGLGEAARLVSDALEASEATIQRLNHHIKGLDRVSYSAKTLEVSELNGHQASPLLICGVNGEHIAQFAVRMGEEAFFGRRVVGIWYWETASLPEQALEALPYLDEIWLSSEFMAEVVRKLEVEGLVVRTFPHPIHLPEPTEQALPTEVTQEFAFDGRFLFLFSFDFNSSYRRKNPHAICEAFARAFPEPKEDGPLCLIKSINGNKNHRVPFELLKCRWAHRPDILFVDDFLSVEEKKALFARANCYVSLHRAEGLSLTLMEAMAQAKPCIATNYSGNLAFMTAENSFLVDYELVAVGPGDLHYPAEDLWAEVKLESAAEAMRLCYENPEEAKLRGQRAQADIRSHHSLEAAGAVLRDLAEQAVALPPRSRMRPDREQEMSSSFVELDSQKRKEYWAQAQQSLQQLKELEKELAELGKNRLSPMRRLARTMEQSVLKSRKGLEQSLKHAREQHRELKIRVKALEKDEQRLELLERNMEDMLRHITRSCSQSE